MLLTSLSVTAGSLLAYRAVFAAASTVPRFASYTTPISISAVCLEIAQSVSSDSRVFLPGTQQYAEDINHYSISSTQQAACSFEPGTPEDVGIALHIIGRTRCPFAVKGSGHASNLGFSSTSGVQIAMRRFSDVTYDSTSQTAKIGAGLIWDDVYAALEPHEVNVAGARVPGIGVSGFALGGGYSWHANQYGLTIDTVEAFELVLPDGTVTNVDASQPDLFFALKGGFNNFGIVTQFTLKTFPQTQVWGGSIIYGPSEVDQLTRATANFVANNADPKANIITSYLYLRGGSVSGGMNMATLFYDAPSPPPGLFDDFLTYNDAEVFTRSFLSLVQSPPVQLSGGFRMAVSTVSVLGYPEDFLQCMQNETMSWGTALPLDDGYIAYTAEPFLPSTYNQATSPSAWPGSREFFSPLHIQYAWTGDGTTDDMMINAIKESAANLWANAVVPEQLSVYGSYAPADTPLEAMYGDNVERLRRIAEEVDPDNVMGLSGGFKFGEDS